MGACDDCPIDRKLKMQHSGSLFGQQAQTDIKMKHQGDAMTGAHTHHPASGPKAWYQQLYIQVLIAIVLGIIVGVLFPDFAKNEWIKAMGDGFVKLIRMVIAPIIFCTVVSGIAHIQEAAKVGRVALKALFYFEIVSTFAGEMKPVDFVLNIIPDSAVGAFARGDILQVLLFAVFFGFALMVLGDRGKTVRTLVDDVAHAMFGVIAIVLKFAPLGAFGAMAYTIGFFGPRALGSLFFLIASFYITCLLFVVIVLGLVARMAGFSIFKFVSYIKAELLIVLGASSSEAALPQLMEKLERLGCSKSVVGLVVPTGYSFNLDGTNIYMTLATLFIAQALGVELSFAEQFGILLVAMISSKGATGITGAGFITLAATLAAVRPELLPGMALVLGIDKFMSECRALTNITGNGVAAIIISWWEGELDRSKLNAGLNKDVDASDVETAVTTG